jgi:hypothetical protein
MGFSLQYLREMCPLLVFKAQVSGRNTLLATIGAYDVIQTESFSEFVMVRYPPDAFPRLEVFATDSTLGGISGLR